jgi:aminoglycoside 6'-N-acetyltransferase
VKEPLQGDRVVLRPVREDDAERLRILIAEPEVAAWWHAPERSWPLEPDEGEQYFVIEEGGEIAGFIQCWEEDDADFRHASIDIFVASGAIGRGLGTDAVRTLARHLIEDRGHHRLTIDPDVANTAAIRCYERVGFRPVGVMRNYGRATDRTGWRDGLLMDLMAGELR